MPAIVYTTSLMDNDSLIKDKIRILVADDNLLNQQVAGGLLRKLGYSVDLASDGEEAFQKAVGNGYHIIFMDIQMPVIDGYEATRMIRKHEEKTAGRVPVIAVTAHSPEEENLRYREAGMDGYIQKPFSFEELENAIRTFALSQ